MTGAIIGEAIQRIAHPAPVTGNVVMIVAAIGVAINGATALMFMSGRKGDVNVRGAFLHMAGDAAIAGGVVIAGPVMLFTHRTWLDPVVSLVVSLIIIVATWSLLRESAKMALQAVPEDIDP